MCRSSSTDAMRLRWGFLEPYPSLKKCPSVSSCPYEQPSKRQQLLNPSFSSNRPHEKHSRSVCRSSSTDAMRLRWGFLEPSPSLKKCPSVSSCPYEPLESAPFSAKKLVASTTAVPLEVNRRKSCLRLDLCLMANIASRCTTRRQITKTKHDTTSTTRQARHDTTSTTSTRTSKNTRPNEQN